MTIELNGITLSLAQIRCNTDNPWENLGLKHSVSLKIEFTLRCIVIIRVGDGYDFCKNLWQNIFQENVLFRYISRCKNFNVSVCLL